jgi:hypothetical protein
MSTYYLIEKKKLWLKGLIQTNQPKHQNYRTFNGDQPNKLEKVPYQIIERNLVIINSELRSNDLKSK